MSQRPHMLLLATVISLPHGTPAHADPVTTVTGGFLLATGINELSPPSVLTGTNGFSFTGNLVLDSELNALDAFDCRGEFACLPGESLSVGGSLFSDSAFVNTAVTLNGVQYQGVDPVNKDPVFHLQLLLAGSAVLPDFGDYTALTLTAPFVLNGRFSGVQTGVVSQLTGQGTATVWLVPTREASLGRSWAVDQMRYDFAGSTAPIPEPTTMLLLGTGLTAVLGARRRLQRRVRETT